MGGDGTREEGMRGVGGGRGGRRRWERVDLRPGLVRPVRTDPHGLDGPTPGAVRGPRWRRSSHGLHVPSHVDETVPEQRILEASMVAPDGCAVTGWAALRWWTGSRWFAGLDADGRPRPVTLVTSTFGGRSQPGIDLCEEGFAYDDVVEHEGVPLTRPCCAVSFEVRRRTTWLADAVAVVDMACASDVVSLEELGRYAAGQRGWTGIPLLRQAVALADENSWSPQESRARVAWVTEAELPRPRCNAPVFDHGGHHLATPDLLDPQVGLVAEYDGSDHLEGPRRLRDVRREEILVQHGLGYVTTLAGDRGPQGFVERLLRAYARARAARLREDPPRWTADQPPWWVPTETVAQRRALSQDQRARLLRYRAS